MRTPAFCLLTTAALFAIPPIGTARADDLFPDKNLDAVVRQYVFEKRNNEEPLVEADVENISTIVGKKKGITNLAGLEKCRSLALLDLAGNEIEDLTPIKDLKNIQSLDLSSNKIKDISALEGLTALQYVQLENNQVTDLAAVAKLENLRNLYLANNQVKDVTPLAGLTKMVSLYLDSNQVSDIKPLAALTTLERLDVRGNGISDISPLSGYTELTYLFLQDNQITDLGVLIEMAQKDFEGQKRFAPFWRLFLKGNPLNDAAKNEQIPKLKEFGGRVSLE
jgi:Leucine-rich repeat (LRR) protein